ncbi:MAG: sensor histidine kinase [Flavobacteriales bacterium]|nr:sensor histidine kinase [Flavobacteriales bacterium]
MRFSLQSCLLLLTLLFLGSKVQSQVYTSYPQLEKKAEQLIIQDTEELMFRVDQWIDSLQLKPHSPDWQYFMLYKAEALQIQSDYAASFQLIELVRDKMLASGTTADKHLCFRVLSLSGECHRLLNDYEPAMDSLQKAVKLAHFAGLHEDEIKANILIAEVLRPTWMRPKAVSYLNRAEQICQENGGDKRLMALIYDRYAACSYIHSEIISYTKKAIEYAEEVDDKRTIGLAHLQIGLYSIENSDTKDSLMLIAADNFRQIGDRRNLALTMLDRCYVNFDSDPELCLVLLDSMEILRDGRKWPYLEKSYYMLKSKAFDLMGEKDSTIYYLWMLDGYHENQRSEQGTKDVYFIEKKFQEELNAATIRAQDLKLDQSQRRFRSIVIILIVIATFLFTLIYFFLRLRKSKREIENNRKEIALINASLESSLEENKVLLYETHHRVKNNLQIVASLLELQSEKSKNELLEKALGGAQNRIGAMAYVHELLYKQDDVKNVDLGQYLEAMSRQIARFFSGEEDLKVTVNCHEIQFPLHRAIHMGIFINELLTNSHKYARKEGEELEINIELKAVENRYHLHYHDNGPGLVDGLGSGKNGSIGLFLIQSMTKQLRGKLNYFTQDGAHFQLNFKK